jgi:hypothetical protein
MELLERTPLHSYPLDFLGIRRFSHC